MGFNYHVFLSHSSPDKPLVEELAVRLRREGIEPWLDKWNLVPGEAWQPAIEQALNECATCAVTIGVGGFGAWQNEEMRVAIDRKVASGKGQFRVIPILLPGVDRPERGKLPEFLVATTWVEFRRSLDDAEAFRRLVCGIRGVEPGAGPDRMAIQGACPYRGLEVFDVEHAPFFFGREALTEWLTVALRPAPSGVENRFLAILGASGSGKSSLARAGLAASLKNGALEGSADWPIVVFKPGRAPMESLSLALAALPGGASLIKDTRDLLNMKAFGDDPKSLHVFAKLALRDRPGLPRLVILVDQAEEVFTLCETEAERRAFFDTLLHAATVADGQVIVVLTIRADFYGKCAPYPALAASMSDHQLLVGPMKDIELTRAIERPALMAGGEFEPGLVGMLLQDVEGQAGALPLLQFTLMELWERREGRRMTVSAYESIGGLQGALKKRADDVLAQFDEPRRELCRRIFLRLTQPGEGSEDTKRRANFDELVPAGADPLAVEAVVRRLADARLITIEADGKSADSGTVEVAHEALIRSWNQLRGWIDADRAGLRLQRQLTEDAKEWVAHGREGSFLYRGPRLAEASKWAKNNSGGMNELETRFLATAQRWRRIGKAAQVASVLAVIALSLIVWESSHKTQLRQQLSQFVANDLQQASDFANDANWTAAISVLETTQGQLGMAAENEWLRNRVSSDLKAYTKHQEAKEEEDRQRKLVHALHVARATVALDSGQSGSPDGWKWAVTRYRKAFAEGRIDIDNLSIERVADLIRSKPPEVREAIVTALDNWARGVGPSDRSRLLTIARMAYSDPWRTAILEAETNKDKATLQKLAKDDLLAIQPTSTQYLLGFALFDVGAKAEAVEFLRRLQHLHPADFWTNKELGVVLTHGVSPQWVEAIRYSTVAVALQPEDFNANFDLGYTLLTSGRGNEAIPYFEKAILLGPSLDGSYSNLGVIYKSQHNYEKATAYFAKAIERNPRNTFPYLQRYPIWLASKDYRRAISDLDHVLLLEEESRIDPKKWEPLLQERAKARKQVGEYDKAIADFEKALTINPSFNPYLNDLAWLLATCPDAKCRDGKKAVELANRACESTAWKQAGYIDTLAAALAEAGDFAAAVEREEKALELLPKQDEHNRKLMGDRLILYKAGKPFHEEPVSVQAPDGSARPATP